MISATSTSVNLSVDKMVSLIFGSEADDVVAALVEPDDDATALFEAEIEKSSLSTKKQKFKC